MEQLLNVLKKYESVPFSIRKDMRFNLRFAHITKINATDKEQLDDIKFIIKRCAELKDEGIMRDIITTPSGGVSTSRQNYRNQLRSYLIRDTHNFLEVWVCVQSDFYRFQVGKWDTEEKVVDGKTVVRENVSGTHAYKTIVGISKDMFPEAYEEIRRYTINTEQLKEFRKNWRPPFFQCSLSPRYNRMNGDTFSHVYSIDFNSAFPSGMALSHPKLKPLLEYIYNKRFEQGTIKYRNITMSKKDYWKGIMNSFCGFLYSIDCNKSCPAPQLSKDAMDTSNARMQKIINKLREMGNIPLMACTDSIKYECLTEPYHDDEEGTGFCQWKYEYKDADMRIWGVKKYDYQYRDDSGYHYEVVASGIKKEETQTYTWEQNRLANRQVKVTKHVLINKRDLVEIEVDL